MKDNFSINLGLFMLRFGVGIVFVLLGLDKFPHPADWLIFFPRALAQMFQQTGLLSPYQFLRVQGIVEAVLGAQLLFGVFPRLTSLCCAALLAGIIYFIGLEQIGIRDLGLLCSSTAIFCLGAGEWSAETWLDHRKLKTGQGLPERECVYEE